MGDRVIIVTETEQPNGYCQRIFKTIRPDQPVAQVVGHEYKFNTSYYIVLIGPEVTRQRIICAAMRSTKYGTIVASPRHCDQIGAVQMDHVNTAHVKDKSTKVSESVFQAWEQGFIDQFGTFFNRQQAWKIAEKRGQIIHRVGGDTYKDGTLYSENLY